MGKDDSTWLKIAYLFFFGVVVFISQRAINTVGIHTGWFDRIEFFQTIETFGSLVIGALAVYWLQNSKDRHDYYLKSVAEARKVTWPSLDNTKQMTLIVAVVVFVFSIVLTIFDLLWSKVLHVIING